MKLLSLFSGIGAFEVALNEENIDWSLDHYCEIDKYACQSYNMIHGTTDDDNLKDVTNIDYSKVGEIDLLTYGFPCQDISLAGEQKGFVDEDGNITRSGLFFNAADVIRHVKPKFAIFENVKNLTSKKFKNEFDAVLTTLDDLGYNTYWKVLNSKNFGIPQNRERVFGISIRKDIDKGFEFPEEIPLMLRLKDMLEDNVDEKYFLKDEKIKKIKSSNLQTKDNKVNEFGFIKKSPKGTKHQSNTIYDSKGLARTLTACDYKSPMMCTIEDAKIQQIDNIVSTGNLEPKILQECVLIPEKTKRGYKEVYDGDGIYINRPHQKRGCVQHEMVSTLKTTCGNDLGVVVKDKESFVEKKYNQFIEKEGYIPEMFNPYNCAEIKDLAPTRTANCGNKESSAAVLKVENQPTIIGSTQKNASVRKDGISPTLTEAMGMGGGHVPMVCNDLNGVCKTVRAGGRGSVDRHSWDLVEDNTDIEKAMLSDKGKNFVLSPKRGMCTDVNADLCQTLTAKGQTNWTGSFVSPDIDKIEKSSTIGSTKPVDIYLKNGEKTTSEDTETISRLRIRKLTPRECWRLMGFGDKYFDRVEGVSNTQLYKQAGNSIVVDVLRAIFRCFKEQYPEYFEDIWEDDL